MPAATSKWDEPGQSGYVRCFQCGLSQPSANFDTSGGRAYTGRVPGSKDGNAGWTEAQRKVPRAGLGWALRGGSMAIGGKRESSTAQLDALAQLPGRWTMEPGGCVNG